MNRTTSGSGIHAVDGLLDKAAVINATTGAQLTYRQLDERSRRFAIYLRAIGLKKGDRVAVLMENDVRMFECYWAAMRSGLIAVPVNWHATPQDIAYMVDNSGAKVIVTSAFLREIAQALTPLLGAGIVRLMVDDAVVGWNSYEQAVSLHRADAPIEDCQGSLMFYSSGTTGRAKGVLKLQPELKFSDGPDPYRKMTIEQFGFSEDTVYFSPAPLYHAAPLGAALTVQFAGGTVVVTEKFDPVESLDALAKYGVTHTSWVPTMFVRMLKLPDHVRESYRFPKLRIAIHGAAPCPVEVKQKMIEWWGPILHEYYGGSEGAGLTMIDSPEWLAHPGSVGRAVVGTLRVCDEDGKELPIGTVGLVYFERDSVVFEYHGDPALTKGSRHPLHDNWATLGDIGHVDTEGYLYLTDRRSFTIISGGVNIYPQIIEDVLSLHPDVFDVAVIGVPNAEMGEEVKAVIQLAQGISPSPELAESLKEFLSGRIARYMLPKSIDFVADIPRLPTGKLAKKVIRDKYWGRTS